MRKLLCLSMVLLLIFPLGGCSKKGSGSSAVSDYPTIVAGVTLKAQPKRAVCLSASILEKIYELGYGDTVVGRSDTCAKPDGVAALPSVGEPLTPDLNKILALKPDVVIVSQPISYQLSSSLADQNIPVVQLQEGASLEALQGTYQDVGNVFGGFFTGVPAAASYFSTLKSQLDQAAQPAKGSSLRVMVVVSSLGHGATGDTFLGSLLKEYGIQNAADGYSGATMTPEQVVSANPDLIFVPKGVSLDTLPGYSSLTAVKNKKVVEIDLNALEAQCSRTPAAFSALCQAIGATK